MKAAFLFSLLVAGCSGDAPAEYPERPRPVDAGTPHDCEQACARLAELGCPEAAPTPEGETCFAVCVLVESTETITLDPVCVATITRCGDVEQCSYGN